METVSVGVGGIGVGSTNVVDMDVVVGEEQAIGIGRQRVGEEDKLEYRVDDCTGSPVLHMVVVGKDHCKGEMEGEGNVGEV